MYGGHKARRTKHHSDFTNEWMNEFIMPVDTKSVVQVQTICTRQVNKIRQNITFYNSVAGWITVLQTLSQQNVLQQPLRQNHRITDSLLTLLFADSNKQILQSPNTQSQAKCDPNYDAVCRKICCVWFCLVSFHVRWSDPYQKFTKFYKGKSPASELSKVGISLIGHVFPKLWAFEILIFFKRIGPKISWSFAVGTEWHSVEVT